MRSSRPNRRERRASRFSRASQSSSQFAGGMLAFGALASAFHTDSARAEAVAAAPSAPRSSVHNIAPRVTILQPSYADLIKGTTQIVIAVETKGAPTKNVEMFIDGVSATGGAAALAGLNSAQFDWRTTTVKDGLRRLTVRVTDENGLRGEAETQVYINNSRKADKTAPTLNWQNVRNGELLHGETKLQLGASDNFGVKYIVITVNPIDQPDRTPALRASLINRAPFEYSLDTTRLPDGVYVLNARAYDMLDNEGSTQRVTFGVTNNGLNPTVIERLNEVLAAEKPVASSTRSSEIATKALPKIEPKANARAPKPQVAMPQAAKLPTSKPQAVVAPIKSIVVPRVVAAKPQAKPVATLNSVKSAPVRIASATIKAPAQPQTPSIAVARPVIERPALTSVANAQTLSGAAVVKTPSLSVENESATPVKIARINEQPRLASVPKTVPKAAQNTRTSSAKASETFASTTVANAEIATEIVTSSASKVESVEARTETATQRAQTPQMPTRLAKLSETRVAKANVGSAAPATGTSQNIEVETATSQVAAEAPQNIEYSMSPRASLEAVAPRTTPRSLAAPVRIAVVPHVEKTSSERAPELVPQPTSAVSKSAPLALTNEKLSSQNGELSLQIVPKLSLAAPVSKTLPNKALPKSASPVRIAELPKSRASKPNVSTIDAATITPTVSMSNATANAAANVVESRVDVAAIEPKPTFVLQRAKTPQRLAALPTRRDEITSSDFAAPLNTKVRPNAAITVSPLTIAAMNRAQTFVPASHVVKRGETLSILAARYGLRAETLASVNGLKKASALVIGQKLSLPRALKVSYRGHDGSGDVQAVQIGDVSAAPFRFLFEQQGGKMTWNETAQRVTAINGSHRVSITIGSREANVGDQKVMMDLAAFLLSGRTMVPVRFFEKAFDTKVEWEPATSRIYVAMSNDNALNR